MCSATLDGLTVRGPMTGGEHAFALAADWLGQRPHIEHDRALAELARRYLAGHGPADQHDLARWAQLPVRDARAAFTAIAPELEQRPDGLVDLKSRAGEETPLPPPRLLGPFDPLLLGWRSRAFVLDDPPEVVTVNGIIRAIALVKGRAAGTWTMPGGRVELRLWGRQSRVTTTALERDAAAVEAYLAARLTSRHLDASIGSMRRPQRHSRSWDPRAGTVRRRYGLPKPERARHDPLL